MSLQGSVMKRYPIHWEGTSLTSHLPRHLRMFTSSWTQAPPDDATQSRMLKELRDRLGDDVDDQLKKSGEQGLCTATLQRWLVARKWNVDLAAKDIREHAAYRAQNMPNGRVPQEEVEVDIEQKKAFYNGYDKQGDPFAIVRARLHIPHDTAQTRRFIEYCFDAGVRLGELRGEEWEGKLSGIIDLAGISYANYDLASLQAIFEVLQNHYPERLNKLFLYRAPSPFYAVWALVSPFIDPVTRGKIVFMTEEEGKIEFPKLFDVTVLPSKLGGSGTLRPVEDVWDQILGKPFKHSTTLHKATVNLTDPDTYMDGAEGLRTGTLRQWLVARRWDVEAAARDLRVHAAYRTEHMPLGRVLQEQVKKDLLQAKSFLNGYDNAGNPFSIMIAKNHVQHDTAQTRRFMEYSMDAAVKLGQLRGEEWGGKITGILDLEGVTYANSDLGAFQSFFQVMQNHYPERLSQLYMYRAPTAFYAMWALISPFLEPKTRAKLVFLTQEQGMLEFPKHVPAEVLPAHMGGTGALRSPSDVWDQLLGKPFLTSTTLHQATLNNTDRHRHQGLATAMVLEQ